jgi:4-diphosphocytidyl-2-C-methyl-D-erythritol kinase
MWTMEMTSQDRVISIAAPAKLNLFLELCGKRPDGYHEIDTLMVQVELADQLFFTALPSREIQLSCQFVEPGTASDTYRQELESDRNLIVRAAKLLQQQTSTDQGAQIVLHKRIPSQAGLGGGSSDAASTLWALNQLWDLNLPVPKLMDLAGQLGSDIPFFLTASPWGICQGRGELVTPVVARGQLPVVIVQPASGLSTKEVYAHSRISPTPKSSASTMNALLSNHIPGWKQSIHNVLDEPGQKLNSDVVKLRKLLEREPGVISQMTGSGSACYALCTHHRQAQQLSRRLKAMGYQNTFVTRTRSQVICPREQPASVT